VIVRSLRLDPDTWWHLKYGESILQTGHWPMFDAWSFTAHGTPGIAYEWGGDVLTALAYRMGGLRGLDVLLFALTSIVTVLMYYFASVRCRNSKAAFVTTVVLLPIAAVSFTLRPQLLGYIFLLITLICLEYFRQGRRNALWILPPVFLLWVNMHGSFVLGFMAIGLYWMCGLIDVLWGGIHTQRWTLSERLRLELATLFCILMLPITPYGSRLATVPIEYAFFLPGNMAHIEEWQPLNFAFWEARLLLILLIAFIVAQVAFRIRYRLEELALFFLITYLTFVHIRFAIVYTFLFAPLAALVLSRWMPDYDPSIDKHSVNAVLVLVALTAMARYLPSETTLREHVSNEFPVQAVDFMKQHRVPGRMFNEYFFGGYLVWELVPEHRVFIDGRGDVYEPAGVFPDYMDIMGLKPDALALLRGYRIDSCLIHRNSPLATLLVADPDWKRTYEDELSAIFVREGTSIRAGTKTIATTVLGKSAKRGIGDARP
jgi:hypothetical protein